MGNQSEINQNKTDVRVKLEQIQQRSNRKRLAPKVEEEIVEDIVVDDIPETHHEGAVQEDKEEVEFTRGCTSKGSVCIWYKG